MSRTHLNAVRIRTEERGYIALYLSGKLWIQLTKRGRQM